MSDEVVCGYRLLRALGASALPGYAALDPKRSGGDALCVVEQLARDAGVSAEAAAEFLRDAKRLSHARHANLARVRDVIVGTNTVLLVTEWIDGETLAELLRGAAEASVEVPFGASLRVIVDLLEGLGALHELRDSKNEPLALAHGEVAPRNVVVASDGRAVLVHPLRARGASHSSEGARAPAPEVIGYLAPEVLLGDVTADRRADIYGAGVLLWEALMGRRMHPGGEAAREIVVRLLGGRIETPCAPAGAPWASGLAEVVRRATSADPGQRYASATEMLDAVRKIASSRVAPRAELAALVERVAGPPIRARRERLAPSPVVVALAPPKPSPPVAHEEKVIVAAEASPPPSDAPPAEVVEIVEVEVPPDAPSRPALPHAPPPLPGRARSPKAVAPPPPPRMIDRRVEMSSTDIGPVASLIAPARLGTGRWKGLVLVGSACAVIAVVIAASLALRRDKPESAERAVIVPSTEPIAATAPPLVSATAPRDEASPAPSGLADEIPWPDSPSARAPVAPTATSTSTSTSTPTPASTPTPTPTLTPTPTPPSTAASPPRKKPPVYDPMGI